MDKPTPSPEEKAAVLSLVARCGLDIHTLSDLSKAAAVLKAAALLKTLAGPQ